MNYILKNKNALFYECGYSCDNALFLKLENEAFFITDARYIFEAKEFVKNAQVILAQDLFAKTRQLLANNAIKKISFDPKDFTCFDFKELSKDSTIEFEEKLDLSKNKRIIKTDQELEILQKSMNFEKECFDEFAKFISEEGHSKSEKELWFKACEIFQKKGKLELSFSLSLGYRVGLDIHELPNISPRSDLELKEGIVFTIESGIYIQDKLGIKIEDVSYLTKEKAVVL